jgi:hypothetical protein
MSAIHRAPPAGTFAVVSALDEVGPGRFDAAASPD